ncbi:MAG: zinc-ribbon domain-containing protein [Actinobacteria bacterium]|nr:MAG: zinc-ribbon domain-containing protein [Actinomycetota bacterium]
MAFCEHCGRELSDQAIACPNCGHPRVPAVAITTRQGVQYAEWWQRAVALIIDAVITGIPAGIIIALAGLSTVGQLTRTDEFGNRTLNAPAFRHLILGVLIAFAIGILYRTLLEGSARGQTVGKMAMRIAVRDVDDGGSIGYGRAFGRWLVGYILWIVIYIPGIIDLLFPLWDSQRQTLHDKAVRSVVIQV